MAEAVDSVKDGIAETTKEVASGGVSEGEAGAAADAETVTATNPSKTNTDTDKQPLTSLFSIS